MGVHMIVRSMAMLLAYFCLGVTTAFAPRHFTLTNNVRSVHAHSTSAMNLAVDPSLLEGSALSLLTPSFMTSFASSALIATIDSDIASIPVNEFAPVFAGGMAVMFGGVLSAIITGAILEKRDLYATVVAASYAQGGDGDEEFWKSLSDEEKLKAKDMVQKLKAAGNEGAAMELEQMMTNEGTSNTPSATTASSGSETVKKGVDNKKADMFSDYGE
uniref:Uncharacterized protein n=1 Tax=Phaeodactylum tricornutum TaxID=2850 RepID=A0A8J9RZR4_PHATR